MAAQFPGVSFTAVPAVEPTASLRSDIAGFAVRTRRGPIGRAVRVDGWREAIYHFGGFDRQFHSAYALFGYFQNGGQLAHVVRVAPPDLSTATPGRSEPIDAPGLVTASATWDTVATTAGSALFGIAPSYHVEATSPGPWANDLVVSVSYLRWGPSGTPEMEVVVRPLREPVERIEHIAPERLAETVNARSRYIRISELAEGATVSALTPASFHWTDITLRAPDEPVVDLKQSYEEALSLLCAEPEVAIIALPDLFQERDRISREDAEDVLRGALARADALLDRMIVLDAPPAPAPPLDPLRELTKFRAALRTEGTLDARAGAIYYPYLWVPDPLGNESDPLRRIPPSGHVAGVISRLDRERGAHHTPANARLQGAVAFDDEPEVDDRPALYRDAINLLRCHPREGMVVWGGRTLAFVPEDGGFLAHRRLIHRLVRAMRRVAEPLVFEENGPVLWLALGRAITTVLLSAFQAGALKGGRPDEAFRVKCDAELNPPSEVDLGRCVCHVSLAPAVPLEFIELRVALSRDGTLETLAS